MLTLGQALRRVLDNEATGNKAECELVADLDGLTKGTVCSVETLARRATGEAAQEIFRVDRSMKNWAIVRDGRPCLRAHPWDKSPNIAYLVGSRGVTKAVAESLVQETENLADRMERLALVGESLVLWRIAQSLCVRLGDARLEHARSEATRLHRLVQGQQRASQAAPVRTG